MRELSGIFKFIGIVIVLIFIGLFIRGALVLSALAFPPTHAPRGYLVPTPASIPQGFAQIERVYSPYSRDRYVLEYTSPNRAGGNLVISESPANREDNFDQSVRNYEIIIHGSMRSSQGCIGDACTLLRGAEKVRDISYLGAHGALYHTVENANSTTTNGYDLLMDDNGKLLRIFTKDGPNSHFSDEMIMTVLNGLVRQN